MIHKLRWNLSGYVEYEDATSEYDGHNPEPVLPENVMADLAQALRKAEREGIEIDQVVWKEVGV
jgi:hypothetical protein